MKRKIAVILAAGIDRYKDLVARDEDATLARLAAARAVLEESVARHDGRVFSAAGDQALAEFASAVEAVRCACDVQRRLRDAARAAPGDTVGAAGGGTAGAAGGGKEGAAGGGRASERSNASPAPVYRIGISIGDVVMQGRDLLGDGVNIAARLQGIASGDGICVSRSVVEHVAAKLPVCFVDAGLLALKNMPEPVHAYRIDLDGKPTRLPPAAASQAPSRGIGAGAALALLGLALAAGGGAYVALSRQGPAVATTAVAPAGGAPASEPSPAAGAAKADAGAQVPAVRRGARCAEILERAQLGRLSADDRRVLQTECH